MRITVRLFAALREAAGREQLEMEVPEGATAEEAWRQLARACAALGDRRPSLTAAVNRRYVPFDAVLQDGDEVVFVPPVSGG